MTAITPMIITAAAPIAIRAEMLRIIFLWPKAWGIKPGVESEELGLRTIGLGRTVGQLLLTAAPQREGLPERDDGDMVLKKPPEGSSPWSWLCEMLKEMIRSRFANCFGRVPVSSLEDKSTV